CQRHLVRLGVVDQGPHQVLPGVQHAQDGQRGQPRLHQGQQHIPVGPEVAAPVDAGRLVQLPRQSGEKLPHQEHAEDIEQSRQHQAHQGVGQAQIHHQLEAGDDEDLTGHHHQCQHPHKEDVLAREIQPVKGIGADRDDQDLAHDHHDRHQNGVQIQLGKIQLIGDDAEIHPLGNLRQELHGDLNGLLVRLDGCEKHPDEGAKGQERRKDQHHMSGEARKPALVVQAVSFLFHMAASPAHSPDLTQYFLPTIWIMVITMMMAASTTEMAAPYPRMLLLLKAH
ncbi:ATP-binding protein, partial [Dysosmobacter welbionis]